MDKHTTLTAATEEECSVGLLSNSGSLSPMPEEAHLPGLEVILPPSIAVCLDNFYAELKTYSFSPNYELLLKIDSYSRLAWSELFEACLWKEISSRKQRIAGCERVEECLKRLREPLVKAAKLFPDEASFLRSLSEENEVRIKWSTLLKEQGVDVLKEAMEAHSVETPASK